MEVKYKTDWKGDMAFEMDVAGHIVRMDAGEASGGKDSGVRPKPLLLAGMTGCTGMDVVSMLKKMKEPVEHFSMDVKAEMSEEHPMTYTKIHLVYLFTGKDLKLSNIEKAVKLSREKYCGAIALMEKATELSYDIKINGELL